MYGNTGMNSYEAKGQENVQNVRQIGNNALYRRGQLWIDSQASGIDPDRDKDKIKIVQRFGSEYFDLAKANTLAENQLLSTQQPDEELLVVLRGQAYWIK
jgi:hypothetical protein